MVFNKKLGVGGDTVLDIFSFRSVSVRSPFQSRREN